MVLKSTGRRLAGGVLERTAYVAGGASLLVLAFSSWPGDRSFQSTSTVLYRMASNLETAALSIV